MNIMKKAWEIAKQGQEKFGGKVKEYFAAALKMAWALAKKTSSMVIAPLKAVALVGTDKQVEWAKSIRSEVYRALMNEVQTEEYIVESSLPMGKNTVEKRNVKNLMTAMLSEESLEDYFNSLRDFQVKQAKESAKEIAIRWDRMKEIMVNPSAAFWIENRNHQVKNDLFHLFKTYVNTGVKNF